MKRKITALALAGWCAGRAFSRLIAPARACWRSKIDASASDPNPQKASRTNSRRVRVTRTCSGRLLDIEKGVEVEQGEGKFLDRLFFQEGYCECALRGRRRSAHREPVGAFDEPASVVSVFLLEPFRKRHGQFVREPPIEQFQSL